MAARNATESCARSSNADAEGCVVFAEFMAWSKPYQLPGLLGELRDVEMNFSEEMEKA